MAKRLRLGNLFKFPDFSLTVLVFLKFPDVSLTILALFDFPRLSSDFPDFQDSGYHVW